MRRPRATCSRARRPVRPTWPWCRVSCSGLDADAVMQLLRDDVRCVAVGGTEDALSRIGVVGVVPPTDLDALPDAVELGRDPGAGRRPRPGSGDRVAEPAACPGRVVAVHGPAGAPGRTTLAIGLAAEHAHQGHADRARRRRPLRRRRRPAPRRARRGLRPAGRGPTRQRGPARRGVVRAVPARGRRPARGAHRPADGRTAGSRRARVSSTRCSNEPRRGRRRRRRHRASASRTTPTSDVRSPATSSPSTPSRPPTTSSWSAPPNRPVWLGWRARWSTMRDSDVVRRSRSWSTGCATRWAGAGATSSGWSRATSAPAGVHFLPEDRPTTDKALVAGTLRRRAR